MATKQILLSIGAVLVLIANVSFAAREVKPVRLTQERFAEPTETGPRDAFTAEVPEGSARSSSSSEVWKKAMCRDIGCRYLETTYGRDASRRLLPNCAEFSTLSVSIGIDPGAQPIEFKAKEIRTLKGSEELLWTPADPNRVVAIMTVGDLIIDSGPLAGVYSFVSKRADGDEGFYLTWSGSSGKVETWLPWPGLFDDSPIGRDLTVCLEKH